MSVCSFGSLGARLRIDDRPGDHVDHIEGGQQEAGQECRGVKLDRRDAGGRRVDDQQDAGRNEDSEAAAGAHDAGGEFDIVAGAQHGGECQQPHQRHHRADDAGRGREHRAGRQRRHRKRAGNVLHRELQRMEQAIENVGALDQIAHEQEQRHRHQHVVRRHLERFLHQQRENSIVEELLARRVVGVEAEADAHRDQGEGDREAQHDDEDEQPQHQHADLRVSHGQAPSGPIAPARRPGRGCAAPEGSRSPSPRRRAGVAARRRAGCTGCSG